MSNFHEHSYSARAVIVVLLVAACISISGCSTDGDDDLTCSVNKDGFTFSAHLERTTSTHMDRGALNCKKWVNEATAKPKGW